MINQIEMLEQQELIQKLIQHGYRELVDGILENEQSCFTKRARGNKSGMCRTLGWKPKQLEDAMAECRRILGEGLI